MAAGPPNYRRGDPMDDYLTKLALFRKPMPADETSLFRAASDQIYGTQKFHAKLKECSLAYMDRNPTRFENMNEVRGYIRAMAILYRRDFLIYQEISKPPVNVTNFGYPRKVILCESFGNHFDCVYPRAFQQKAAICQSLIYEVLYKGVFHMDTDVAAAIILIRKQNMRFNRALADQHGHPATPPPQYDCEFERPGYLLNMDAVPPICEMDPNFEDAMSNLTLQPPSYYLGAPATMIPRRLMADDIDPADEAAIRDKEKEMEIAGPPFPFRVAKALDPVVYRNVEYDIWLEDKKAHFRSVNEAFKNGPFPSGTKCLVRLADNESRLYRGVVQEVDQAGEKAIVFLLDLGEMQQVQMDRLVGRPRKETREPGTLREGHTPMRNRMATWTHPQQPQDGQTPTSYSWPITTAPNNRFQVAPVRQPLPCAQHYQASPIPIRLPPSDSACPAPQQAQTYSMPLSTYSCPPPVPESGQKDSPILIQPTDTNVVRPTPIDVPSQMRYPMMIQTPPARFGPPPAQMEQNAMWASPNLPMQPPNMVLPAFPPPFPLAPAVREPTAEDITTLRQFYELGGCEYFRQFLAANQPFSAPSVTPQQYQPPVIISPQHSMGNCQTVPVVRPRMTVAHFQVPPPVNQQ